MHERIKKMCNDYRCINGRMPESHTDKQLKLAQLQEIIAEVREDWLAIPLDVGHNEQKTRLYKKLKYLLSKERLLKDQS